MPERVNLPRGNSGYSAVQVPHLGMTRTHLVLGLPQRGTTGLINWPDHALNSVKFGAVKFLDIRPNERKVWLVLAQLQLRDPTSARAMGSGLLSKKDWHRNCQEKYEVHQ